jgi:transposase
VVEETHTAPLPATCPHCAAVVRPVRVAVQFQEDLPAQHRVVRRFDVQIGRCTGCQRRIQGRHPLQTSDALGAAAAQLGPHAVALAVLLNKRDGLSYGKVAGLLRDRFGLSVTRGGLVHAIHCAARQAQPTYAVLPDTVRGSPVVTVDETSWRVDAGLQWLWVWATPETTVTPSCRAAGSHKPRR